MHLVLMLVCLFLPQVQIAACDTFRSGAVEQLRTHCNRLSIPLYERGYEKDPARVAHEAIKAAERSNIDVLLVDTAGEHFSFTESAVTHHARLCQDQLSCKHIAVLLPGPHCLLSIC